LSSQSCPALLLRGGTHHGAYVASTTESETGNDLSGTVLVNGNGNGNGNGTVIVIGRGTTTTVTETGITTGTETEGIEVIVTETARGIEEAGREQPI
jgi:hypothetical protein